MEKNGYNCKSYIWHYALCHYPEPFETKIPLIYIYRNPKDVLLSMKNRPDIWLINQVKLSPTKNENFSDENLLQLLLQQFKKWSDCNLPNLLIVKYDELFESNITEKLNNFLNDNIDFFPIELKPTSIKNVDLNTELLFEKYKQEIDFINNF